MKKYLFLIALFASVACSKEALTDSGMYSGSYEPTAPGENYMIKLSTDLIPDFLIVLETALTYDNSCYYATSTGSKDYISGGKSIRTVGNEWTINTKKKVKGTVINCIADGTWSIKWTGPYSLYYSYGDDDRYAYETTVDIQASMLTETSTNHFDWKVVANGSRTERAGYACTFQTAPDLTYSNSTADSYVWDLCNGAATMLVTKNGEKVDLVRTDYLGTSNRYFRGL